MLITFFVVVVLLFGLAGLVGQSVAMVQGGGWFEKGIAGLFLFGLLSFIGLIVFACNYHSAQTSP